MQERGAMEAASFLAAMFQPSDLICFRPVESWVTPDGKQQTRAIWRGISYRRLGVSVSSTDPTTGRAIAVWKALPQQAIADSLAPLFALSATERANLYFGCCPRYGGGGAFDLVWQIRRVNCLWVDVDHVDIAAVAARCRSATPALPPPTAAVATGNGVHLYWLLDTPFAIDDCSPADPPAVHKEKVESPPGSGKFTFRRYFNEIQPSSPGGPPEKTYLTPATRPDLSPKAIAVQDTLSGIAAAIGGDATHDLSRILRLPGSLNRKNERNGKPPRQSSLIRLDPSVRYPLSAFSAFQQLSEHRYHRENVRKISLPAPRPNLIGGAGNSRDAVKARNSLADLVNACIVADIGARSEADFRLCCTAVEKGWPKDEVWSRVSEAGKFGERGREYFDRTWAKAELHAKSTIYEKHARVAADKAAAVDAAIPSEVAGAAEQHGEDESSPVDSTSPSSIASSTATTDHAEPPGIPGHRQASAKLAQERRVVARLGLAVLGKIGSGGAKVFSAFHRRVETIPDIDRLTYEHVLQIAGENVKECIAKDESSSLSSDSVTLATIKQAIALLSGYRSIEVGTELGVGCWRGLDKRGNPKDTIVIVGHGEAGEWNPATRILTPINVPWCDGHLLNFEDGGERPWISISDLAARLARCSSPDGPSFIAATLSASDSLFARFKWKGELCPAVMTGLVMATFLQTLWEWRPQMSIIGETMTGKSTLFDVLEGLFCGLAILSSDITAAGVRQSLATTAKVMLCDEFDQEDAEQLKEQKRILKMIRSAGRGSVAIRGTAGGSRSQQKAVSFMLRHICWMTGIQFGSDKAADQNRNLLMELLRPSGKIHVPPPAELRELGLNLLAVAVYHGIDAVRLASRLRDATSTLAEGCPPEEAERLRSVNHRLVDGYAVSAAMIAVCRDGEQESSSGPQYSTTDDDARQAAQLAAGRDVLRLALLGAMPEPLRIESDHGRLIGEILRAEVRVGGAETMTVAQALEQIVPNFMNPQVEERKYVDAIGAAGIGVCRYANDDINELMKKTEGRVTIENLGKIVDCGALAIVHTVVSRKLLWRSHAGQAIDQVLSRAPLSVRGSRRRIGGQRQYAVLLPFLWVFQEFLAGDWTEAEKRRNSTAFGGDIPNALLELNFDEMAGT